MAQLEEIHHTAKIHPTARINVTSRLSIGAGAIIGEGCEISGRDIEIGRELWMDRGARIGGGSCFERQSSLRAGHFLHLGQDVFINTARHVEIGDEVGLGTRTALYTHGAYLSALDGFPVSFAPITIGNNVWIPGATVNPGVVIGDNVVVGVNSLVTKNLPAGCLAAGSPAKILKEDVYPSPLPPDLLDQFWTGFFLDFPDRTLVADVERTHYGLILDDTIFDIEQRRIDGPATRATESLRNQLRRYGIRFYSSAEHGAYVSWS